MYPNTTVHYNAGLWCKCLNRGVQLQHVEGGKTVAMLIHTGEVSPCLQNTLPCRVGGHW